MAGSRLEFSILGPLAVRVDGAPIAVGGPKQRALLALLLLSANRVVSRELLVEELFAEQSVNSADHALRNHVSRLRKLLAPAAGGEPRLVARAPGYLLRVEPGELDLERFEELAAAGRELLAAGDARPAAQSLRAAERLWHGRPLADLELERFARIEVERLEELRLAAVEERIDAELSLGRHLALVPELEALAAEHPFRERFRAQLMLGLYRCGRQAEGLEVYRHTRSLLSDELGLEPGPELQELERAILGHDPALAVQVGDRRPTTAPLRDVCPFKGLAPFESADAEFFFGRERLTAELLARLTDVPLLALVGASGSGKTSLLRAGLLPELPHDQYVLRPSVDSASALERIAERGRRVLAVDQFEELFAPTVVEPVRRSFVDALVDAAWDPERRAPILIALRADFFGHLSRYTELADLVGPNHVLLGPMTIGELRRAVEGPAERTGLVIEPALVDALVEDVGGEPGGLPLLSTALLDLWRDRDGDSLTLAAYERSGGVRGAVGRHAEAAFRSLAEGDRDVGRRILLRLVDAADDEVPTRRRVPRSELDEDDDPRVARVLEILVEGRLLVADDGTVELVHEALLERWPRLANWLDEDAQGRRLHRHLTQAAAEWEAGGRDPGELYRGARLAAAVGWVEVSGERAGMNRLERAFLEESRTAFARANRRLRTLLAAAVLLLVSAVVAGAVAVVARGSAKHQAIAATAQRLGAQALVEPTLDRSLLLAREGINLDDSLATRSNLLAALLRSPAALAVLHGGGSEVVDDALATDGRTLAVRGDDGRVMLYDTRTLRMLGHPIRTPGQISYFGAVLLPKRAMSFSPDGRTLAVGDSDGAQATLTLVDTRTGRIRASIGEPSHAVTADVSFAPDGRTLLTGEAVSGRFAPASEVLVGRRTSDGRPLARSAPIPDGRLIGFLRDSRFVFVTSEHASYLLDARTLARVRTFSASGAATLSPDGRLAALGGQDGSVKLLDLRRGSIHPLARSASPVLSLAFSADARTLATASEDGSVDIWDVPTRSLRETFVGHSGAAFGLLFARDGSTLYSGSSDGSMIAWDVRGERRLGRPFRFAPAPAAGQGVHTPPRKGADSALAVSPDGTLFATVPAPNRVTIWRLRDQHVVSELRGPCGDVASLAFSHGGRYVVAVGTARQAVVWDLATRRVVKVIGPNGPTGTIDVGFSPDDRLLATAENGGQLTVYAFPSGRTIARFRVKGSLQALAFSPDGSALAAGGLSGDVAIWSTARRALERTIHDPNSVQSLQFAPDGKEIATGELTGNVEFWNPATGGRVGRVLGGQNGDVLGVAFDPSGNELLTTSSDGTLRLWDLASGKLVGAPLPGAGVDTGGWGTFTPDGRQVIAAFWSGTGVVWSVDSKTWEAEACRIAHRNLTRAEWHDFLPGRGYRQVCP